ANEEIRQKLRELADDIRAANAEYGFGNLPKDKSKEFLKRWTEITSGSANHQQESVLRTLYSLVENEDFPAWYDHIRHLPKEQQAKLGHMWREEWKLFVRDMMSDPDSKEVLYLRDL